MPTIIDSLITTLELDSTKFTQGQKDAAAAFKHTSEEATKRGKEIEAAGKRGAEFFGALQSRVLGLFAAFTAGKGLKEFVSDIVAGDSAVGRFARNLGISTETLSTWMKAAELAGDSADGAKASFQGFANEIENFRSTGQSSIIPWLRALGAEGGKAIDLNKPLAEIFKDIAANLQKIGQTEGPERVNFLSQQLGLQGLLNLLGQGPAKTQAFLDTATRLGTVTKESAENAELLRQKWVGLLDASETLGRSIQTSLTGPMVKVLDVFTDFAVFLEKDKGSSYGKKWLEAVTALVTGPFAPYVIPKLFGGDSTSSTESYIREAAKKRGIDPDVAVAVAKSEGLNNYTGDRGSSFGPFQLHYGGVASGGMAVAGLGDDFTRKTGLNARDPSTVKQQIDFALDYAAKHGWGAWHGWHGIPFAGIGGLPSAGAGVAAAASISNSNRTSTSTSSSTTTIENINVHTPATDGPGIVRDIKASLEQNGLAIQGNYGLK